MIIKTINNSKHNLPKYATKGSVGMDLRADLKLDSIIVPAGYKAIINTNIHFDIPEGIEGQIRPRSGLKINNGIDIFPGTIDSDYKKDIKIILTNNSEQDFHVTDGMRIAQIVFNKIEKVELEELEEIEFSETEELHEGFGSTGTD